jgi:hypothetical protein
MPYSLKNKADLPSYVKTKDSEVMAKWVAIFNASYEKYGEEKAFILANTWLKKHLTTKRDYVKRSFVKFEVDSSKKYISRDKNGNEYISLVLSSTNKHLDGKQFSEKTLKRWNESINVEPIIGDVDHILYDRIINSGLSDEAIKSTLKKKPGIAKTVKSVYQKGKLWVRVYTDKRYSKLLEKVRGVSVEAACNVSDSPDKDWELLGFTFNVKTTPADPTTGVHV